MTRSDENILDLLAEKDAALKPKHIWVNLKLEGIDVSRRTIMRRKDTLQDAGLIEEPDQFPGYYVISSFGRAWLNEELEVADLQNKLDDAED